MQALKDDQIERLLNGTIMTDDQIDPDNLYNDAAKLTFIYNPDHTLFTGANYSATHVDVIMNNREYYNDIYKINDRTDALKIRMHFIEKDSLLGRIGETANGDNYVAFWNDDKKLYDSLLRPCLLKLSAYFESDTILATPYHNENVFDFINKSNNSQVDTKRDSDTEKLQKLQLMRQLHLMKPQAKRAAMQQLGLNPNSNKNAWQKGSEEAGIVKPGQKWWASTSENLSSVLFNNTLNQILESIHENTL